MCLSKQEELHRGTQAVSFKASYVSLTQVNSRTFFVLPHVGLQTRKPDALVWVIRLPFLLLETKLSSCHPNSGPIKLEGKVIWPEQMYFLCWVPEQRLLCGDSPMVLLPSHRQKPQLCHLSCSW